MNLVIVLLIILVSVILHELAHGLVAYWLGDTTAKDQGRLSLNPIKHIDPFMSIIVPVMLYLLGAPVFGGAKPVPINSHNLKGKEWGMALVALAGPLTNLILAFIAFLIGYHTGLFASINNSLPHFICHYFMMINLGFAVFNIIPIPPLDGSRILYAIAPDAVRNFLNSVERYGIFIVYILILFLGPLFSNIMVSGMNGILQFFYMLVGA